MAEPSIVTSMCADAMIETVEGEDQENLSEAGSNNERVGSPQANATHTGDLRCSSRDRKPTPKVLDNLEQEAALRRKKFSRMYVRWKQGRTDH